MFITRGDSEHTEQQLTATSLSTPLGDRRRKSSIAVFNLCRMWPGTAIRKAGHGVSQRSRGHLQTPSTMWAASSLVVVVWLIVSTSASAGYPVVLGECWPVDSPYRLPHPFSVLYSDRWTVVCFSSRPLAVRAAAVLFRFVSLPMNSFLFNSCVPRIIPSLISNVMYFFSLWIIIKNWRSFSLLTYCLFNYWYLFQSKV